MAVDAKCACALLWTSKTWAKDSSTLSSEELESDKRADVN